MLTTEDSDEVLPGPSASKWTSTGLTNPPKDCSMINVKLTLLLTGLLLFTLSAACFASGYHVYDWDGAAKEKDGKEVRKSRWQPGFVLLADGTRRVGESW